MTEKIHPPWTPAQVAALTGFQYSGSLHPFTCPNEEHDQEFLLVATKAGWVCSVEWCTYTQDWAHAFMANPDTWTLHRFTARPVSAEEERIATERAVKMAEESERSAEWFKANSGILELPRETVAELHSLLGTLLGQTDTPQDTEPDGGEQLLFWDESAGAVRHDGRVTLQLNKAANLAQFTPAGQLILQDRAAGRLRDALGNAMQRSTARDFHEPDEDPVAVQAAFDAGEKGVTSPAGLRERYAAALRDAACDGSCNEPEDVCDQKRVQPYVWHHGVLHQVTGTPEVIADTVLAIRDEEVVGELNGKNIALALQVEQLGQELADEQHLYTLRTEQWKRLCREQLRTQECADKLTDALAGALDSITYNHGEASPEEMTLWRSVLDEARTHAG